MLNKKDPLIGAVQEVMKRNQTEREAAKAVNEYFGVEDRKALPHEYQGQWNAAYQQVLNEGLSPAQQKHMDVDDDEDIDHNDLAIIRARKKKKKLEEADEGKPGLMFKKIAAKAAKRYGSEEAGNRVAGAIRAKMAKSGKLEEASIESIQEEIANNLAEQAEYVYENYGEEGLVEFYDSLTEEQLELLEQQNDRRPAGQLPGSDTKTQSGSSTWDGIKNFLGIKSTLGKKTPQPDADSDKRPKNQRPGFNAGSDPTNASGGQRAGAAQPRGSDPTNTDSGQRAGAYQAPAPIPKARPKNLKTNTQSAPKAKPAQSVQAAPKKKLTFFQKQELRRSAKNDTMDQTRRLEKRYGVKPGSTRSMEEQSVLPKNLGPGSGFAGQHSVGNKTVRSKSPEEFMKQTSTYQGMSDAIRKPFDTTVKPGAPKSDIKTPIMDRAVADKAAKDAASRKALGNAVMSGRVGDPGKQNFIQNARANKERVKAAGGDGSQFLPKASNDPKLAQAMKDRAKEVNDNERAGGKPLIRQPVDMRGGGSDYRAAVSQPASGQTAQPMSNTKTVKKDDTMWDYAKQNIKQSRNLAASGPLGGTAFMGNAGTSGTELANRKVTNKEIAAGTEKIKALNPTVNPRKMQIGSKIKTY